MPLSKHMNYDKSDQPLNKLIFHPQQWTSKSTSTHKFPKKVIFQNM